MATVTVPSGGASPITLSFGNAQNTALAQSIAGAIQAAGANLFVGIASQSGGGVITIPTVPGGKIGELIIPASITGSLTVSGPTTAGGYSFVVDEGTGDTLHGSPGLSILGAGGNRTLVDPAAISLGDTGPGAKNLLTVSGAGDNVALGDGSNTIFGIASGSIAGGTGSNEIIMTGDYAVTSQGAGDITWAASGNETLSASGTKGAFYGGPGVFTVVDTGTDGNTYLGGTGAANVTTAGSGAAYFGGDGVLTETDTGTKNTIVGGNGTANVTLSGTDAVFFAEVGNAIVTDTGTGDIIVAGAGSTSLTASGTGATFYAEGGPTTITSGASGLLAAGGAGAMTMFGGAGDDTVFAGMGVFDYVGGAGTPTLVGGSGGSVTVGSGGMALFGLASNTTVVASSSSGISTVVGAPGGITTFNSTGAGTVGSVFFTGGQGNETLNAAGSSNNNLIFGGFDTAGHNLLVGGSGSDIIEAGTGADTLTGNGSNDLFAFKAGFAGGADMISDFSSGDAAQFLDYNAVFGRDEATHAISTAQVIGGNSVLTLGDGTTITFVGVSDPNSLTGHVSST